MTRSMNDDLFVVARTESCDVPPVKTVRHGDGPPAPPVIDARFQLTLRDHAGQEMRIGVEREVFEQYVLGTPVRVALFPRAPQYLTKLVRRGEGEG